MEAAVEHEPAQALAAERAERAAAVLDGLVAEPVAHAVGDAGRDRGARASRPSPRCTRQPVTASQRSRCASSAGNVVRVVLQIRVHRDDPRRPAAALKPASVAAVSPALALSRTSRTRGSASRKPRIDLGAPVAAAVVDEDDLEASGPSGSEHGAQLGPERREVLFLVVDRDDDREVNHSRPRGRGDDHPATRRPASAAAAAGRARGRRCG